METAKLVITNKKLLAEYYFLNLKKSIAAIAG